MIKMARIINADSDLFPLFGEADWNARPYIEIKSDGKLCYIISERGNENERKETYDLNELLYWVFADITFGMSCTFELRHRVAEQDCRRVMFRKQEELLGLINKEWESKEKSEHLSILNVHPFNDNLEN